MANIPTDFKTSIWLTKSDIDISSGHTVLFKNKQEQIDHFTKGTNTFRLDNNMYKRNSGQVKLEKSVKEIDGIYNYLVYINPEHENKYMICNIVDYMYISDTVTEIFYTVDYFQTYIFDVDYNKESLIVRRNYTKSEYDDIMNLPYEDLDRGRNSVLATDTFHMLSGEDTYFVITLNTPIKAYHGSYTTISNSYQETRYINNKGETITGKYDGFQMESALVYVVNYEALKHLISTVFNTKEHVNKLQKISFIPFDMNKILGSSSASNIFNTATGEDDDNGKREMYTPSHKSVYKSSDTIDPYNNAKHLISNAIKGVYSPLSANMPEIKARNLTAMAQYFMRSPFTSFQVSDITGNLNEYDFKVVTDKNTEKVELRTFGTLGIIPSLGYSLMEYDTYQFNSSLLSYQKSNANNSLSVNNDLKTSYIIPEEIYSIVNNYMAAFLQAQQNQLSQQKTNMTSSFENNIMNINADAQRQLTSSQFAFDNNNLQRETEMNNFAIKQANDTANHGLSTAGNVANMAFSAVGNLAMGNFGGALGSVVGGGINMGIQNKQFDNSLSASSAQFNNSMDLNNQLARRNLEHQQAMTSDIKGQSIRNNAFQYRMQQDTLNARMLDVKNAPDSLSNMTGGTLTNSTWNRYNIAMRTYVTHPYSINRVADYLAQYGFLSNKKENVKTVLNRVPRGTFIQTSNINLSGSIPLKAMEQIKSIFNGGIFIWKDIKDYRNNDLMKNI